MTAVPRWLRLALPGLALIVGVVALRILASPEAPPDLDRTVAAESDANGPTDSSADPEPQGAPEAADQTTDARLEIAQRVTPERYREVLARIRAARGEATVGTQPEGTPAASSTAPPRSTPIAPRESFGSLDPQYIQDAVREIVPLFAECYELALEEDDTLAGRLVMLMTIGGEEEVGGVIEHAAIAEDSELHHPLLDECVRETAYTIELPAPDGGGQVEVRYPLTFSPDDEDDANEEATTGRDPAETQAGP